MKTQITTRNRSEDAVRIGISNADDALRKQHASLMDELMKRALEQNPELARQLEIVKQQQERVKEMRRAEEIKVYHEWLEKQRQERIANRKIRYDDKRNYNALNAIRRDSYYKSMTRLGQIQMELDRYWNPRGLEPPAELIEEYRKLKPKNTPVSQGGTPLLRAG